MKHKNMVPLMGAVVTVSTTLNRSYNGRWIPLKCPLWVGWIVGFTYRLDGHSEYNEDYSTFVETSRQPCVLITSWPTKRPVSVPLDGYCAGPPASMQGRALGPRQACMKVSVARRKVPRFAGIC